MESEFRKAIVVGASSGVGLEIARLLAADGARVAVVARRKDRLDEFAATVEGEVLAYAHDVTHFEEVPGLFQTICQDLGGLDLLIYAAGVMPEVGFHEFSFEKDKAMIDVNVLGAIAWLNQGAVRFENVRHGSLVAIGSVAGERGRSGQPVYNASKACLATYMEALRNRLCRSGVEVVTIKPGPMATQMTAHLHFKNMMDPVDAARKIIILSRKTGEYYLKFSHRVIFFIIRNFPSFIFRKLKV